jgi:large conductance mechanosensitive channel
MLKEFKDFIAKGNVMDMAVGIIMGAAFTAIVTSMVKDLLNPVIGLFLGGVDFSNKFINLSDETYTSLAAAQEAGAATFNYGLFINAVINFVIVAFVVFLLVKGVNRIKEEAMRKEEEEAAAPAKPSAEVQLLTEIRDSLKKGKK